MAGDDGAQRMESSMPGELKQMLRKPIDVGTAYSYSNVQQKPYERPQIAVRQLGVGPIDKPTITPRRSDHFAPNSPGPRNTIVSVCL